jgi:hypothetical protein
MLQGLQVLIFDFDSAVATANPILNIDDCIAYIDAVN